MYNADLEKYSSNAHNFEGLTPETMAQLVNITKNNEIYKSDTYPTITCEWSECQLKIKSVSYKIRLMSL